MEDKPKEKIDRTSDAWDVAQCWNLQPQRAWSTAFCSSLDEGPKSAAIAYINTYAQDKFDGAFRCQWTKQKGRVLHATRDFTCGQVVLIEDPLHVVQEEAMCPAYDFLQELCREYAHCFIHPTFGYWCALRSLTEEQLQGAAVSGIPAVSSGTQDKLLMLYHKEILEASEAAERLAEEIAPAADAVLLDALMSVWMLNSFEYSDNPRGSSVYFFSSFMSHSCEPNAVWHRAGRRHVLHARCDIRAGDEVCISYFDDAVLLQPVPVRRFQLHVSKDFWCTCLRCCGEEDLSRGFVCSKCHVGKVFACTPATGPAENDFLLSSHLWDASCAQCGHSLSQEEATCLVEKEDLLRGVVNEIEASIAGVTENAPPVLEELRGMEIFINKTFAQHMLAVLAWEQIAAAYALIDCIADQQRLLKRRCEFCELAYPGLNASHAWALEAYGDALCQGAVYAPEKKGAIKSRETRRSEHVELAMRVYEQAREILSKMFGETHDYVQDLDAKYFDLFADSIS